MSDDRDVESCPLWRSAPRRWPRPLLVRSCRTSGATGRGQVRCCRPRAPWWSSAGAEPGRADDQQYVLATSGFHSAVGKASGNPVLALAADSIYAIWSVRVTEVLYPADARAQVLAQHEAIARAIERHDPKRAGRLMREHMLDYVEYCEKRYPARMDDVIDWK
jgi:hypothetical protein